MLEWLWFAGFMIVSLVCAKVAETRDCGGAGEAAASWQLAAHGAALLSLVISWERIGAPVLMTMRAELPQSGSQIADLTAYALTGFMGLAIVGGIPLLFMMLLYKLAQRNSCSRMQ